LVRAQYWTDLLLASQRDESSDCHTENVEHRKASVVSSALRFAEARRAEKLRIKQQHRDRDKKLAALSEIPSLVSAVSVIESSNVNTIRSNDDRNKKRLKKAIKVKEHVNINAASMRHDLRPIDESCSCYTCRNFSRSYLHHLFAIKESLGGTLVCSI
jgi:hypothetical protein